MKKPMDDGFEHAASSSSSAGDVEAAAAEAVHMWLAERRA